MSEKLLARWMIGMEIAFVIAAMRLEASLGVSWIYDHFITSASLETAAL